MSPKRCRTQPTLTVVEQKAAYAFHIQNHAGAKTIHWVVKKKPIDIQLRLDEACSYSFKDLRLQAELVLDSPFAEPVRMKTGQEPLSCEFLLLKPRLFQVSAKIQALATQHEGCNFIIKFTANDACGNAVPGVVGESQPIHVISKIEVLEKELDKQQGARKARKRPNDNVLEAFKQMETRLVAKIDHQANSIRDLQTRLEAKDCEQRSPLRDVSNLMEQPSIVKRRRVDENSAQSPASPASVQEKLCDFLTEFSCLSAVEQNAVISSVITSKIGLQFHHLVNLGWAASSVEPPTSLPANSFMDTLDDLVVDTGLDNANWFCNFPALSPSPYPYPSSECSSPASMTSLSD